MHKLRLMTLMLRHCKVTETSEGLTTRSNAGIEKAFRRLCNATLAECRAIPLADAAKCLTIYTRLTHNHGVEIDCVLIPASGQDSGEIDADLKGAVKRTVAMICREFKGWCTRARQGELVDVRPASARTASESDDDIIWMKAENPSALMKAFSSFIKEIQAVECYRGAKLKADRKSMDLAIGLPPAQRIVEVVHSQTMTCRGRASSVNGDEYEVVLKCPTTTDTEKTMTVHYADLLGTNGMSVHETVVDAVKYQNETELSFTGHPFVTKDVGGHRVQSRMVATELEVVPLRSARSEAA